jgi:ribosomal protein S18 acetylase RimI-like enzyme
VITVDDLTVGTFSLKEIGINSLPTIIESDNLYLYRVALLPEYQGKNIGLKVTNYACQISRDLKKILYLDCWAGNVNLKNFYLKAGFDFCGDFPEEDYMLSVFKYE